MDDTNTTCYVAIVYLRVKFWLYYCNSLKSSLSITPFQWIFIIDQFLAAGSICGYQDYRMTLFCFLDNVNVQLHEYCLNNESGNVTYRQK